MKHNAILIMMLGCMPASGNLYALTAPDEKKAASSLEAAEEKRSPPVKQGTRQPAKPATTFRPSERIGADSAVSFPVDI